MSIHIPRDASRVFCASETVRPSVGGGREQSSTTFREAREFLDKLNVPGSVTVWTSRSQQSKVYATRSAEGIWTPYWQLILPIPYQAK